MKVLLVNHHHSEVCGVWAHGRRMANILAKSKKMDVVYGEANSWPEYLALREQHNPDVVIYNYYPSVMPWAHEYPIQNLGGRHLGIIHEVTQDTVNNPPPHPFAEWFLVDTSLKPAYPGWHQTIRPMLEYSMKPSRPVRDVPIISTFGFAFSNKGFLRFVQAVCNELPRAVVRIHTTVAAFHGGHDERYLNELLADCQTTVGHHPGIELQFSSDFRTDEQVCEWLDESDLNCLFYDPNHGRGISSAVDYMVAVGRPMLLSDCGQFRHVASRLPQWPTTKIPEALGQGDSAVRQIAEEWSHSNFIKRHEEILGA